MNCSPRRPIPPRCKPSSNPRPRSPSGCPKPPPLANELGRGRVLECSQTCRLESPFPHSQPHASFVIRHSSFVLALLSLLFIAAASTLRAQAPPNDVFANRITLNGTNIIVVGSNTNATKEPGEPGHAGNSGGKSVWWTWTAPTNGDLVINTDGSDFDTLLGVYTGSTVSSLSLVASNDDHGLMLGPSRV